MKAVLQRVSGASVAVGSNVVGKIERGLLILFGVSKDDTEEEAKLLASKIINLRIFEDGSGKLSSSLLDVSGDALIVSNFTLYADCRRGRRPDFGTAAPYDRANCLYNAFCRFMRNSGVDKVETGVFGGDMAVSLINDGPVTVILDTDDLK